MARLLTTGIRPNGTSSLPPMPSYRFNREDAEAISIYLQNPGSAAASGVGLADRCAVPEGHHFGEVGERDLAASYSWR